jgi:hypothetical protein
MTAVVVVVENKKSNKYYSRSYNLCLFDTVRFVQYYRSCCEFLVNPKTSNRYKSLSYRGKYHTNRLLLPLAVSSSSAL